MLDSNLRRFSLATCGLFLLLGSMALPAAVADDAARAQASDASRSAEIQAVREEIKDLRERSETLIAQRALLLSKEVDDYLAQATPEAGLEGGGGLEGLSIHAGLTSVALATINADPSDTHAVTGDVDLDFDFAVTDNLDLFIHLTGNTSGHLPAGFGPRAGIAGATASGMFDGIGVDGTVPTSPGSARVYEAGIRWSTPIAQQVLHVMAGALDPRNYFAQNAFAGDSETQFLNNLFDDPPAISWPTTAAGNTVLGLQVWMTFGDHDQYRVDLGWYNSPGQFFNKGIFLWQISWTTQLSGRELHLRAYGQVDDRASSVSAAGGVSADWWATEKIGVFARITARDNLTIPEGEFNFIESDWQLGAMFVGLLPGRPDDTLGIGFGLIKGPVEEFKPGTPENSEEVVEIYYRYMAEDGKLQITPLVQFIVDPGMGGFANSTGTLVIAGLRIYVPF